MGNIKWKALGLLAVLALAVVLAACGAEPPAVKGMTYNRGHNFYFNNQDMKYTKADYDLALSFRTGDYQSLPVAEFNRKVMDWQNEEAYHKTEEALQRLAYSLPKDDPNADFILYTLNNTWSECETKHYNACQHQQNPSYAGEAMVETYGDIFGDKVVTSGAYADYWFDYQIADETALTVGQRDEVFRGIDQGMKAFLSGQDQKKLKKEENMEKALEAELKRLLKAMDQRLVPGQECGVSYCWDGPEAGEAATAALATSDIAYGGWGNYSKAQLKKAIEGLKFEGYQTMSIAEFNRKINAAFEDDKKGELLDYAFEMALDEAEGKASDATASFLRGTVLPSLEEYRAKAEEVYSGKQVDPEYRGHIGSYQEEDVFGDQVRVGAVEAEYTFTYRILNADTLTVKERNQFLTSITQGVQGFLDQSMKGSAIDESAFKKGLLSVGKTAGNSKIEMTGCQVEYFSYYN